GVKAGTFYGTGTARTNRDFNVIGEVAVGSQSVTGCDCDVETDDLVGLFFTAGAIEKEETGYSGIYFKYGDFFGGGDILFTATKTLFGPS
ncbi:unnamed protein product, partial [marine sediment metagenome]